MTCPEPSRGACPACPELDFGERLDALARPPEIVGTPHHEYPMSMARVVDALGAEALDRDGKTRCCEADLAIAVPELGIKLCRWLIEQARAVGADCLISQTTSRGGSHVCPELVEEQPKRGHGSPLCFKL